MHIYIPLIIQKYIIHLREPGGVVTWKWLEGGKRKAAIIF